MLYRDDTNLFEGFEGGFGWAGTDNLVTDGSREGDIAPCNGKYFYMNEVLHANWYIFIANAVMWPKEMWENPENWCMKFEMFTQNLSVATTSNLIKLIICGNQKSME